jgi:hypothetical protein
MFVFLLTFNICAVVSSAPLFSRVSAALTGPNSAPDIKGMFENFIREIHTIQQRK